VRLVSSLVLVLDIAPGNMIFRSCKINRPSSAYLLCPTNTTCNFFFFGPLPLFAIVIFEIPWQWGFGGFVLYLIGIAQTLADVC
jgi:hypothetical protein